MGSGALNLPCPVCDARGAIEHRGGHEVTVGTVAAAVERRPVVVCPSGHETAPPELAGASMSAVEEAVPRARSRLLRADACRSCRATLRMPVRRTTRSVTVDAPTVPIVTLHLDLPMTRCGDCGLDQVPSRSHEDLTVVVPALFAPGPATER